MSLDCSILKGGYKLSYSICKADFYYGAFLSVLINNGINPAIVELGDKRNIYELTTDNGAYKVYTKYVVNSKPKDKLWNVIITEKESDEISRFMDINDNVLFVVICAHKQLINNNTEIAILKTDELKACIDLDCNINKNFRLSIRKKKHSPYLSVYGTHRADKVDGRDNAIKISRQRILEL